VENSSLDGTTTTTVTRAMSGMGSSSSSSGSSSSVVWTTGAVVGRVALAAALATRMKSTGVRGNGASRFSSSSSSSSGVTVRAISDSEDSRSASSSSSSSSSSSNAWLYEDEKKLGSSGGALDGVAGRSGGGVSSSSSSSAATVDGSDAATRVREGSSRHERHAGHYLSKPYAVYRIDAKGQRVPYKQIMTRRQLLRDTDLSPRDLRRIDPTLGQTTNTPAVIVREDSVLVNLGVRIIICADHALLLEPDTMMSVNFLESWTTRASAAPEGSSSEGMEVLPFELTMVEAALQETCAQLENRLEHCTRRYRALERKLQTGIEKTTFDELRFMKQALVQLESRASAVRDELLETLDDEDDIERMTLSSAATGEAKEEEQEEVENLLEYYVQQTEAVHSATEALLENTRDLDESISVTLSARRLEVSKIELMLSIASFAAAIGAVVTGIFGMNLTSTFESSVAAFYLCTSLLLSSCIGMSAWLYRFCKKRNIL
jgi:magnesium transporter